jgi:hypothetical protein
MINPMEIADNGITSQCGVKSKPSPRNWDLRGVSNIPSRVPPPLSKRGINPWRFPAEYLELGAPGSIATGPESPQGAHLDQLLGMRDQGTDEENTTPA